MSLKDLLDLELKVEKAINTARAFPDGETYLRFITKHG